MKSNIDIRICEMRQSNKHNFALDILGQSDSIGRSSSNPIVDYELENPTISEEEKNYEKTYVKFLSEFNNKLQILMARNL